MMTVENCELISKNDIYKSKLMFNLLIAFLSASFLSYCSFMLVVLVDLSFSLSLSLSVYIYMRVCMCVCVLAHTQTVDVCNIFRKIFSFSLVQFKQYIFRQVY